ncbi:putative global transcription activator [Bacillus phage BSTP8]|nr:putative global transcription activator [Bacillus phage BSTP5]QRI44376.1 putative global transcription activator [Bacillus phage BSTP8]QRI44391.1 hypothetical protein [Bacillus phage BSTP10]QRI44521.1 putative global transcription activator [Bacillus phage BSTP12]
MGRVKKLDSVKIFLEGQSKIKVTGPYNILKLLLRKVDGLNLLKDKTALRTKLDELTFYFLKHHLRKMGITYYTDPKLSEWSYEQTLHNRKIARMKCIDDMTITIPYSDKLRKYQRVDVALMQKMKRLILGNEPGTGKTLESIAYCDLIEAKKILIVASKSLLGSWASEIEKWSSEPDYKIIPVDTTYKKKEKTNANLNEDHRFNIINYEMLRDRKGFPKLWSTKWDVVICDEAHRLKGRKSKQTDGASQLKTDSLILATGTWITNNHHEVFQLLQLLDPKRFTSYWQFVDRFCKTENNYFNEHAKDIVGTKNMKAYRYMMNPYLIQRKKKDVLTELPPVIHKQIPIEMTAYQNKHYKELFEDMMTMFENEELVVSPNVVSKYMRLRQVLLTPALLGGKDSTNKTDAVLDIIENTDDQIVVFSWFKGYIKHLETILTKKDISFRSIHGDIDSESRTKAADDFRNGKVKVMLGTIKAMSEGLNLQTASTMIFTDKSYVPADNEQAIARIDRLGQKRSPIIYHLKTVGTVEEMIDETLAKKQDIIDEASAIEEIIKKLAK